MWECVKPRDSGLSGAACSPPWLSFADGRTQGPPKKTKVLPTLLLLLGIRDRLLAEDGIQYCSVLITCLWFPHGQAWMFPELCYFPCLHMLRVRVSCLSCAAHLLGGNHCRLATGIVQAPSLKTYCLNAPALRRWWQPPYQSYKSIKAKHIGAFMEIWEWQWQIFPVLPQKQILLYHRKKGKTCVFVMLQGRVDFTKAIKGKQSFVLLPTQPLAVLGCSTALRAACAAHNP